MVELPEHPALQLAAAVHGVPLLLLLVTLAFLSGSPGCSSRTWQAMPDAGSAAPADPERVILLHGLGSSARRMYGLGEKLAEAGYHVEAWDYPSTRRSVAEHSDWLKAELQELTRQNEGRAFHIVTHSLGGIITRKMLLEWCPEDLKTVVMLAPPNKGSGWATNTAWLISWLMEPMPELRDEPDSLVNQLGSPDCAPIGIIAGESDTKSRVANTHLPNEADHVVVPGGHTFIMDRDDTTAHIKCFLRTHRFCPPVVGPPGSDINP